MFQVNDLANLGGGNARDIIYRMMSHLMEDSLAVQFNWKGRGRKSGVANLNIITAVKCKFSSVAHFSHNW